MSYRSLTGARIETGGVVLVPDVLDIAPSQERGLKLQILLFERGRKDRSLTGARIET